jgi:SAM-dependent methyltransferase/Tfp pilus assembly protein PilF
MSIPSNPPSSVKKKYSEGIKAFKKSSLIEAETFFAECIAEDETFHDAWLQLGLVWARMGRTQESSDAFQMAVALNGNDLDSVYNLGLSLIKLGFENEGLPYLSKACDLSEDSEIAHSIGNVFYKTGDYKSSSFFFLKAYQKDETNPELIKTLAISLYQDGDTARAVHLVRGLLLRFPSNENYRALFSEVINKYAEDEFSEDTKKAIEICLEQENIRHRNFALSWCSSFITDPAYELLRNFPTLTEINENELFKPLKTPFLCMGLQRNITSSAPTEFIFTHLRRYFTSNWQSYASWPKGVIHFLASLAVQCWYNDFIYFETPEEKENLQKLLAHLETELVSSKKVSEENSKLLALACCYKPLYEVYTKDEELAIAPSCKSIMVPLIKAQLKNPRYETSLIPKIKSFTEIEDAKSKAVQKMYEKRPYPRWTSANSTKTSESLKSISSNLEILIAGCGTGQEPALYASVLPEAKITAIDLSRSSIAYGMRMAEELGYLNRITFLHGDLMKVGELNKKFDYVVSSGVLHHLKEPDKGLAAILDTLKPGGKMSIALYSKIARDKILNPASEYIKEKDYTSSLDNIRQFRQDILQLPADDPRRLCTHAGDFFNLSECNDLLFHIQEHRYTFPLIQELADRHGLSPYSVNLSPQRKRDFALMFPDGHLSDLALMDKYEHENPEAFIEMYKVYFQRKGSDVPHPLDVLIKIGAI